jgi:hypothetical protein
MTKADLDSRAVTPYYTPTMKNIISFSLGVGALLGAVLAPALAAEPPGQPLPEGIIAVPSRAGADISRKTGKVLVLDNERTLTGDIERVDERYRIKRLIGETWVPANKVLRLCASLEEAYAFLQSRANLGDPDERLRLADWCRQHAMHAQALTEAEGALALRPGDERAKRLSGYLKEMLTKPAPKVALSPERVLPRLDVTAESLSVFAAKVQPILMNACANCHTAGRGGSFQLMRTYHSSLGDRRSLEQNLATVLAQVNVRDPQVSRLLTKSVSLHGLGMSTAPLHGRQTPAYLTLERWVIETLANNPQLHETKPPLSASASAAPPMSVMSGTPPSGRQISTWGDERANATALAPAAEIAPGSPRSTPGTNVPSSPETTVGPPQTASSDPVDPDAFNRHFYPNGKADRP